MGDAPKCLIVVITWSWDRFDAASMITCYEKHQILIATNRLIHERFSLKLDWISNEVVRNKENLHYQLQFSVDGQEYISQKNDSTSNVFERRIKARSLSNTSIDFQHRTTHTSTLIELQRKTLLLFMMQSNHASFSMSVKISIKSKYDSRTAAR